VPDIEVKNADGKLIHTYQIHVDRFSNLVTNEHLFEMAKRNAIEDELVSEKQADELKFSVKWFQQSNHK
jgi:hypothetical protein